MLTFVADAQEAVPLHRFAGSKKVRRRSVENLIDLTMSCKGPVTRELGTCYQAAVAHATRLPSHALLLYARRIC